MELNLFSLQCSVSCGNGEKRRTVTCSGGEGNCNARNKPLAITSCNLGACPVWRFDAWSRVTYFAFTRCESYFYKNEIFLKNIKTKKDLNKSEPTQT